MGATVLNPLILLILVYPVTFEYLFDLGLMPPYTPALFLLLENVFLIALLAIYTPLKITIF